MLGSLFSRDWKYSVTDTQTGSVQTFTIAAPPNGFGPTYGSHAVLGIPAVFRAVTLLSDVVGSMPWHAFSDYGNRQAQRVDSVLLDRPNPPETRTSTISALVSDYLLNGNAIGVYTAYNEQGYPTAVVPVSADAVSVKMSEGRLIYKIGDREFDQDEIFHVKGPTLPGELRGLSRIELFTNTFQLAKDQERGAKGASNSGVPTGVLRSENPDLTVDEAKAIKEGWMKSQETRSIAFLSKGTEFQPISWNPSESQLLDARKFSIHEVALAFGVPLSFLGVESNSMSYTNTEMESLTLLKYTINGILVRFEEEFSKAHPRGTYVKANIDSLMKTDTTTRYQAHQIGLQNKFLLPSEVRALEDLPPMPELDEQFLNPEPVVPVEENPGE